MREVINSLANGSLSAFEKEGKMLNAHTGKQHTHRDKDESRALPCYHEHLSLKPYNNKKQPLRQALWEADCS